MKCIIKRRKVGCQGLFGDNFFEEGVIDTSRLSLKKETSDCIDLDNYLYHGIGTYLEPYQKLNRLRAILDYKAILRFELANSLSHSPKCNDKDQISICQRQSFLDDKKISESFNLFVSNGISIILEKDILETLNAENNFDPNDIWEWLDGEFRIKDKIPSRHFVGIGFPCRSLEETAQRFKNIRQYSLTESVSQIVNSEWYKDYCSIINYMDYNDVEFPIYSIISGKQMGNLYSALSSAYNVSSDDVANVERIILIPENQRIGTIRNSTKLNILTTEMDEDFFCK